VALFILTYKYSTLGGYAISFMKRLLYIALICAAIYACIIMLVNTFQTRLIFFPGKLDADFKFDLDGKGEEVFFKTSDHEIIHGLFYEGTGKDVILYFHGNAGDLSSWQRIADDFTSFGFNLLIIDYRGYGKSTGQISEQGFYTDAEAGYQFLKREKRFTENYIIAYGRSIGSGVAVDLCSKHHLKGLILESPYASLSHLINERVPYLFPNLWLRYRFDSLSKLRDVRCPLLIIHGEADGIIPIDHSQQLFDACDEKKHFIRIPGGPHNNLNVYPQYFEGITLAASGYF
jgi:uncharacterized protein